MDHTNSLDIESHFINFLNSISCETTIETIFILTHSKKIQSKKDLIKRLQLKQYYKSKSNHIYCSICCDNITEKEFIRELKCNHKFHKRCIDKWLTLSIQEFEDIKCPLCRKKIEWY